MISKQTDSGVSPVVGIILMVAVTVALVALASNFVFDIGSESSTSATATVEISPDNSTQTIETQLIKNDSADTVLVEFTDLSNGDDVSPADNTFSGVGSTVSDDGSLSAGEEYRVSVIGVVDGEEQVIRTEEVNFPA